MADHPVFVAVTFAAILAASVPVLAGVHVYMSIYELSPRAEYYDHFVVLNQELGWDNLGAVLLTPNGPDNATITNVTEPAAIRYMHDLEVELEKLPFVEGALSLAKIVEILNSRPYYLADQSLPTGFPEWPDGFPEEVPNPESQYKGFPPEGDEGDARIEAIMQVALTNPTLAPQLYGNILSADNKSALLIVVMETGATGQQYRDWQVQLLETGLRLDGPEGGQYHNEMTARPLSIDIIYSTLDNVAFTEGPYWIMAAVATAVGTLIFLFRRFGETIIPLIVLLVVISATLAVASLRGIDFNMLSLLVAALIFAAGVDYAMHVTARYREERTLGYDSRTALLKTIKHSGPALLITSITTTGGFASLYFSLIPAIGDFGIMVGASIFMAFLVCLSLLPVLLVWADKLRKDTGSSGESAEAIESRRAELEEKVRKEQRNTALGRLGRFLADRKKGVAIGAIIVTAIVASPLAFKGVEVWGASYLDPYPIFETETYPMQALTAMNDTFGIPNEIAVVLYGDATDPAVVGYLDELDKDTRNVHARTKSDSIPAVLRFYTAIINPDPNIDRDRNGIPDTRAQITEAYRALREDPATSVLVSRVVVYKPNDEGRTEYPIMAHRIGIAPQPVATVGTDVANYRESRIDLEAALTNLDENRRAVGLEYGTTGLVVLATEVVDAIIRGNTSSVVVMLVAVFVILMAFWRNPILCGIGMIPVVAAVITQYSLMALLEYEVTYISLILTGMVMGIGVDDSVHFINRVREEVRNGREPEDAVTLASAEIGSVLVGTTVTTMAPFFVILGSVVTWAQQTALLVIPTLFAALIATLFLLPPALAWHARAQPQAYRLTVPTEELGEDVVSAAQKAFEKKDAERRGEVPVQE